MKIYNGIIKENNLELDLAFIGHILSIEQILFLMKSLSPNFVEKEDQIYLLSNLQGYGSDMNNFDNSTSGKEKYINNISISDVFYFSEDDQSKEKEVQMEIGSYILEFWKMRLLYLFPQKKFNFLISENGLFDESGVCITFYQTYD
ncbi:hypothetical protein ODZ84_21120 [Chryseobacterium fluminis]|uniref:hypothetical protein n=1 Tax=Chryseobacterium fluminis TaxID=2983606 RepID=UPI00224EDA11|nr:hypothetical protein [Chryseobacterium sp. MMS21-Ot14]UZT97646.1 hypothetical protein ODZ84_21120 [Chryseobacterium sp. MMS21-Ot14]